MKKKQMYSERKLQIVDVHIYQIRKIFSVAKILNCCGKDMAQKYDLHHWDNHMLKSLLIVGMCLLKNNVYVLMDGKEVVATFQIRKTEDALFFEKLAVLPLASGKGYGSYCMKLIEEKARKIGMEKVRMEVYDKSKHAIDFYVHKGYSEIRTEGTLKYQDIVMEKVIGRLK